MNKKTRISVLLTSVVIALLVAVGFISNNIYKSNKANANQSKVDSYEKYLPTIEQLAKECGLELAKKQCPNVDITVKGTTPLYNVTNDIVGYSVAFESNGVDYGYANLDFTTDQLFTDFAISKNANSIYEELSSDFAVSSSKVDVSDVENKLYNTNGLDYAVTAEADGEDYFFYGAETYTSDDFNDILEHYEDAYLDYYDNIEYEDNFYYGIPEEDNDFIVEGKIADWFKKWIKKLFPSFFDSDQADEELISPTPYPEHSEVLKKANLVLGDIAEPVMLPQYDVNKSLVSQETIMTTTKRYACGLVALTAICRQEDIMLNNNLQDTFNKLWDVTDTQKGIYDTISNYGIDGIECSGTSVYMMSVGMTAYGQCVNALIRGNSQNAPTIDFYKNAVDNAKPSVLCYQIAEKGGHGVSILGYTSSTVGTQTFDYILAADGWYDDAPRYVMYYPNLFESTTGIVYDIVKQN